MFDVKNAKKTHKKQEESFKFSPSLCCGINNNKKKIAQELCCVVCKKAFIWIFTALGQFECYVAKMQASK